MYFAVLGKNSEISMAELEFAQPRNIKAVRNNIITFDSDFPDHIKQLGGIIKRGRVVSKNELVKILQVSPAIPKSPNLHSISKSPPKLIGVNDENLGKRLKSECGIRRFKLVKLAHTDKEVKEKGMEIIQVSKEQFGIVEGYQPIDLYEVVDFEKPARSMQMGMMPAKLTHIMLNVGLSATHDPRPAVLTIYDPFVGSGTTGFLANHFGYDFIGSDIDISAAEKNKSRRFSNLPSLKDKVNGTCSRESALGQRGLGGGNNSKPTRNLANPDKKFELFTHDICLPFEKGGVPLGKGFKERDLLILTEGRLGPIITAKSTPKDVQSAQVQVLKLYESFLDRIMELKQEVCPPSVLLLQRSWHEVTEDFMGKSPTVTCGTGSGQGDFVAICAIPYYVGHSNTLEAKLQEKAKKTYPAGNCGAGTSLSITSIPEIYARKDQLIGRKIIMIT